MKKNLLALLFAGLGMMAVSTAQTQALADTSLELSGAGGTQWTSTSTNFMTVLCDVSGCGNCGGPCAPHTGTYFAWFGGAGGAEIGTLSQTFNVASGASGNLHFWLMVPNGGVAVDSISATLDGNQVWFKLGDDTAGFESTYKAVSVSLGMVTTGSHTLAFRGNETGTAGASYNTLIDDITVTTGGTSSTETHMLDEGIRMVNDVNNHSLNMFFNFTEAMDLNISIIDMNGRIVDLKEFKNLQDGDYTFNTSELSSGVYSVYFRKGNNSSIGKKFYVQK
jgi:hypothetical protein